MPAPSLTGRFAGLRRQFGRADHIHLVLLAILIGLLGGLCAVGFRALIGLVSLVAWHRPEISPDQLRTLPFWWKIAAPVGGGAVVGLIVSKFASETRGHGVPEVMEAVALRGGRIRPRIVFAKMLASATCIGSGGSVGREGPIVQIGSAVGSAIGQWLRVDEDRLRTLVGCGAAAGIAATFNAPIAGALFSAEVILGNFAVAHFSPIVISSVAATVVSRAFLGDFPAFIVPAYRLTHPGELIAYTALGILAAFAALAFVFVLYRTEDLFARSPLPPVPMAMLGGGLVGLIGLVAPEVFGVGYDAINGALTGSLPWLVMLGLILAKIFAVSITIGSGGSGGVFAPSLFIGAMLGGSMGTLVHSLWPASTSTPGAYALVGMGAVVAGATRAPIMAILIIFELTADYEIILPLMISSIVATLLATRLQSASIYTLKLLRRGIDLRSGRALNILSDIPVTEAMTPPTQTVDAAADLSTLVARFATGAVSSLIVVDDDGAVLGRIDTPTLRAAAADQTSLAGVVIAEDLIGHAPNACLKSTDTLADAMHLLAEHDWDIAVVSDARLVGVLRSQDVIARYNAELFRRDIAAAMTTDGTTAPPSASTFGRTQLVEIPVPDQFVDKTLRDLDIRRRHEVTVLTVKHSDGSMTSGPGGEQTCRRGDVLLVLGTPAGIGAMTTPSTDGSVP